MLIASIGSPCAAQLGSPAKSGDAVEENSAAANGTGDTRAGADSTSITLALDQVLVMPSRSKLPSGWGTLLDNLRAKRSGKKEPSGLFGWTTIQILPAIHDRARRIEFMTRHRQMKEAAGRAVDLHRLALHLIDRLQSQSPPPDAQTLDKALQIEVLVVSLEQSCGGENPGRAPYYAREIAHLADGILQLEAPPAFAPVPASAPVSTPLPPPPLVESSQ